MSPDHSGEPFQEPLTYAHARTIVLDESAQRQVAFIDAPVFLPTGSVIELGQPNRDAAVIGTRLLLGPGDIVDLIVLVNDPGEGGEVIPRHPADRIFDE